MTTGCSVTANEGGNMISWYDPILAQGVSQIFGKPIEDVTQYDLSQVKSLVISNTGTLSMYVPDSDLPKIEIPNSFVTTLRDLEKFSSLESLRIYARSNQLKGYEFLGNIDTLTSLNLSGSILPEDILHQLSGISNLQYLHIPYMEIDYSVLTAMDNLKELQIAQASAGEKLSFTQLNTLPTTGINIKLAGVILCDTEIPFIASHSNIVEMTWFTEQENLLLISSDSQIEHLYVQGIDSLEGVQSLSNLQSLRIHSTSRKLNDLSPLSGLKTLKNITLSTNATNEISLQSLTNLTQLESLELQAEFLPSLDGIQSLSNLKRLSVTMSLLEEIGAIRNLKQLTHLDLSGNLLTDISALGNLNNLGYLDLSGNEITNISAIRSLSNLKVLYLDDNQLEHSQKELATILKSCSDLEWFYAGSMYQEWFEKTFPDVRWGNEDLERNAQWLYEQQENTK